MRLSAEREALVDVSAALASRDPEAFERTLRIASRLVPRLAVDEVLLQAHLFVGFPIALEAMILWRRVLPLEETLEGPERGADWDARGERVCGIVYGANYEKLRSNVTKLHPDLDRWMLVGGYGRVIGRPGLDLATRELCIAALLAVWDAPRQFHSHVRGALHAGASPAELEAALDVACRHLDSERTAQVRQLATRVLETVGTTGGNTV